MVVVNLVVVGFKRKGLVALSVCTQATKRVIERPLAAEQERLHAHHTHKPAREQPQTQTNIFVPRDTTHLCTLRL